ncbi:MAG: uroporphyrinogen decarboxylase family protein [Chloroflexota bacterium]
MSAYTHRERTLAVVAHREPDRVALGAYSLTDVCYRNLRAHLGLPPCAMEYQGEVSDVVQPHEDLMRLFVRDTRDGALTTTAPRPPTHESDLIYQDSYGIGYRKHGVFYYFVVGHPLAGERTVADVERHPWHKVDVDSDAQALAARARALRAETDCALVMNVGGNIFSYAWHLCGDDWFIQLATNEPFVEALLERLLELQLRRAEALLGAVGPEGIDIAICTTDDYGMQTGLLFSPALYRRHIKHRQRRFFDYVRAHSRAKIFMHNDGAIYPLIGDFVDIGVEILNPVQVECDNLADTARLKREFGRDLTFWGAINIQQTLTFGTPAEVKAEVRRRLADLATGGGYILTPRWALRPEVPPENICAIYEAVEEFGGY